MTAQDTTRSLWRDFDGAWYRYAYPIVDDLIAEGQCKTPIDVYSSLVKPLEHSPNPFLSETWYLARYEGVKDAVTNGTFLSGFDHFCRHGYTDLRPHWLFDPVYYRRCFQLANGRDLDDALDGDPYDHFLRTGQYQGLTGHWLFDPAVYTAMAAFDIASRIARYGPFTTYLRISTPTRRNRLSPTFWFNLR